MKRLSTGFMVLALIGCGKDDKSDDNRTKPESQKPAAPVAPAPVTPAPKPSSQVPAELLGSWTVCKEYGLEETVEGLEFPVRSEKTVMRFDAEGTLSKTFAFYSDAGCTRRVTEAGIKAYIERLAAMGIEVDEPEELMALSQAVKLTASYAINADLGQGQYQYNVMFDENVNSYETLQITGNTLRLSYACEADDVESGFCDKVTGDTEQNRAVLDARADVMSRVQ